MMKTKALLIVLALCMILSVFSGCSSAKYEYNLDDYITLGDTTITVDQSEIDDTLKAVYQSATSKDKKTDTYSKAEDKVTAQKDDIVNIDYEVKVNDGTKYNDTTKKTGVDVTLGAESFKDINGVYVEEIEIGLLEAKVKEKFDIKVKFADDYAPKESTKSALNGKEAVFTVTVNSIKRNTYPTLNDANVSKYFIDDGYKTVDEFKKGETEKAIESIVWSEYFDSCIVKNYPEKEMKIYYNNYIDNMTATAESYGITLQYYLQLFQGISDMKTFYASAAQQAKIQVKSDLIVLAALKSGVIPALTEDQFNEGAKEIWERDYKTSVDSFEEFIDAFEREDLENAVNKERLIDLLVKNHKVNDDVTKNGFKTEGKGTRYYKGGKVQYGWQTIEEKTYYFDYETGYMLTGHAYAVKEGTTDPKGEKLFYEFSNEGVLVGVKNGFYNDGKTIRFFEDGKAFNGGWKTIEEKLYYFFEDESAAVGDVMVTNDAGEKILGRFTAEGVYERELISWITTEEGTRYYYRESADVVTFARGVYLVKEDGNTYYFGTLNGYLAAPNNDTNVFVKDDMFGSYYDTLYLFKKVDGTDRYAIVTNETGFFTDNDNNKYYFNKGVGLLGWQNIDGDIYFFSSKEEDGGKMLTGAQTIGGKEYTFGDDGKLSVKLNGPVYDDADRLMFFVENEAQTGVQTDADGNMYFFLENGYAKNGWIDADGDGNYDYYAREYKFLKGTTEDIDGKTYVFGDDGKFTEKTEEGDAQ